MASIAMNEIGKSHFRVRYILRVYEDLKRDVSHTAYHQVVSLYNPLIAQVMFIQKKQV